MTINYKTDRWLFLAIAVLLSYPVIKNLFWWVVTMGTTFESALCLTYVCLGLTLNNLTPAFRGLVRSALWFSVMYLLPQVIAPPLFTSKLERFGCLSPALACCVSLRLST